MSAAADTISRFFVWWFGELAACVPARLRALLRRRPEVLSLTPGDHEVTVTLHRRGKTQELGRLRLEPMKDLRRAAGELLRGVSLRNVDVVMALPAEGVLRRRVSLPLAAQENLREVLAFEMDRHTPFKSSEVAFDFRVVGNDLENKRLNVDLTVVRSELLERVRHLAEACGLSLDRIGVSGEEREDWPINLLADSGERGGSRAQSRLLIGMTVLAMILAIVAVYLPLHAKQRTLAAYEAQLVESRAAALEVEALKERLATRIESGRFLINRRLTTPTATALLAEVTQRLPDNSWLVQLRWQADKLLLSGYSPAAATLISGLEESALLSGVRFRSPVTADPRVGKEQFNISADVSAVPNG